MKVRSIPILMMLTLVWQPLFAQDKDLFNMLEENEKPVVNYTSATFKATHVIIGQSIENTPKGNMQFLIQHHFGLINSGYQNMFGLNKAFIRIGAEYGINNRIAIGFGLNTYKITWDGYAKVKILRQSTGARKMPFTLSGFASVAMNTQQWPIPNQNNYYSSRLSYAFELILARKFTDWFSLQINPVLVHKNLVATKKDHNDIFALGAGTRIKLSKRVSVNGEYYYVFPNQVDESGSRPNIHNSASLGIDIETGGHVFQIFLTNSEGLIEQYFIPDTRGDWFKGEIYLGFNISRMLTIVKPKMD
jgi:opacity protein-like surface antigen